MGRVARPRPVGGPWQPASARGPWSGGPPPTMHTVPLPLLRGNGLWLRDLGPVGRISAPGRTPALKRWWCKYTHPVPLQRLTQHEAEHSFTIPCTAVYTYKCTPSQIHTSSRPHSVSDTPSHRGDAGPGAAGVLQVQGASGRSRLLGVQGSLRSGPQRGGLPRPEASHALLVPSSQDREASV